ncbi:MAG: hypothetical protein QW613_02155 [Thermoprotei archaeon]
MTMKAPICNFCLTSTILCSSDQAKLDSGRISQLEVDVSRAIFKLEKSHKAIASTIVVSARSVNGFVIVLIEAQIPFSLTEILSINKDVGSLISKDVRIVEKNAPLNKIVQELLLPAKVMGVSNVWLPDGSRFIKVRLNGGSNRNEINTYVGRLNSIVKEVLGLEIFLED